MLRWYQPYWAELKAHGSLRLEVPYKEHTRIVKGVRKEYYKDLAWRLELEEASKHSKILVDRTPAMLIIYLKVEKK